MHPNNLIESAKLNKLCTSFGIKISPNTQLVQIARNNGYDSLFIDLEHGWLSLAEAASLCSVGHLSGITPFVRVPHQCGNGFVQRVLDGGAMGVIFPHIETSDEAKAAVKISKYPPMGCRSIIGSSPVFSMKSLPQTEMMNLANQNGSTVIVMVESGNAVNNAEEIASVEGVDVVLVGAQDLCIDLNVPGQIRSEKVKHAMETVSYACRKTGKIFGLAGVYDQHAYQDWAINILGARFLLVQQDISILAAGSAQAVTAVPAVL